MVVVRTCIGCRTPESSKSLIRLVSVENTVIFDQKLPGRGAWLHPKRECLKLAVNRKAFGRAFKSRVEVNEEALTIGLDKVETMLAKNE